VVLVRLRGLLSIVICLIVFSSTGCVEKAPAHLGFGRVSFSETDNGDIFYTTLRGELCLRSSMQHEVLLPSTLGTFTDVDSVGDGKTIAVVESKFNSSDMPQIVLLQMSDSGHFEETLRVNGLVPRFSSDGNSIYFAKPSRFVPQMHFGGNFWVDFNIYKVDLAKQIETKLSENTFFLVDDIALDNLGSRIFLSVKAPNATGIPEANIIAFDTTTNSHTRLTECIDVQTCSAEPGMSADSKQLLFTSDREEPYKYLIYSVRIGDNRIDVLPQSRSFRFARLPEFSRVKPSAVLALVASEFTSNGEPKFDLLSFANGYIETKISYREFEYSRSQIDSR